jgi:hypothetical protein
VVAVAVTQIQDIQAAAAKLEQVSKADIMCTLHLILVVVVVVLVVKAWMQIPARVLVQVVQVLAVILPEPQYSMVVVAEQHNTTPLEPQQAELVVAVLVFMQVPE